MRKCFVICQCEMLLIYCMAAAATVSCGGTTSPAAPTQASITVTVSPNPATATRCNPLCVAPSGNSFPFEVAMNVAVQESAHVGGNVNFINVAPVTADGTQLPTLAYNSDVLIQRTTTNHVAASGSLNFYFAFFYATGVNNAALTVTISWQVIDDKGNQLSGTTSVPVNDPSPPSEGESLLSSRVPAALRSIAAEERR